MSEEKPKRKDVIKQLKALQGEFSDYEDSHVEADEILCNLLNKLGFNDVVKEWEKVGKWYA